MKTARAYVNETGYAFDRLADEQGFAVVYPDAYKGYWNACNAVGDYSANRLNIDDVGFLTGIVDKLITEIGVDRDRVFAAGVSRGGHMAYRLALEAPSRFRAVAAVAASVPVAENFKCKPAGQGTSSVMIMNGTKDPINPVRGWRRRASSACLKRGKVRSARDSGQYLAELNHIPGPPATQDTPGDRRRITSSGCSGATAPTSRWSSSPFTAADTACLSHTRRYPRLLGPTPKEPNGPATRKMIRCRPQIQCRYRPRGKKSVAMAPASG